MASEANAREGTGSVRWVGHPGVTCDEALAYTVTDEEGTTYAEGPDADAPATSILQHGHVISGIPEDELGRFLLNSGFEPADSAAENAQAEVEAYTQARVNGSELDEFEIQQRRAREAARASRGGAELSEEDAREIEERSSTADPATQQLAERAEGRQEERKAQRTTKARAEDTPEDNSGEEGA